MWLIKCWHDNHEWQYDDDDDDDDVYIYMYTSQYHDDMTATDGIQVWEAAIFFMTRTKYAEVSNKTMIYPLVN